MASGRGWQRFVPFVLVAVAVVGWQFVGEDVRDAAGSESSIPPRPSVAPDPDPASAPTRRDDGRRTTGADTNPVAAGTGTAMRIVTWNLRNFGAKGQDHDLGRLRDHLVDLDADIIAIQELVDPDALRKLRPDWELTVSRAGGRGGQHLALWADPRRAAVSDARDDTRISLGGSVRPAFVARVHSVTDPAADATVIVLHLKARPEGADARKRQWGSLVSLVGDLDRRSAERDLVVLGDFNVTGDRSRDASAELRDLEKTLGPTDLRRVPARGGCSAYWQGERRDAWLEPSLLDLVWVRGVTSPGPAHVGAHCAKHTCQTFRSTRAYPDLDYRRISDHCPVVVDLQWP